MLTIQQTLDYLNEESSKKALLAIDTGREVQVSFDNEEIKSQEFSDFWEYDNWAIDKSVKVDSDAGIDLVAKSNNKEDGLCAIKYVNPDNSFSTKDIDSFISASLTIDFTQLMFVDSSNGNGFVINRKATFEEESSAIILDNTPPNESIGNWLKSNIQKEDKLRFVSAYFTIYGYEAIMSELENTEMQFLFGDHKNVGEVDPKPDKDKPFQILNEELQPIEKKLERKWLAIECEKWANKKSTQIKTIKQNNFLHGKMYHLEHLNGIRQAVSGSSNFTKNGLGLGAGSNLELNLIANKDTTNELESWFDNLWENKDKVENAIDSVLEALNKLGKDQTPEFIYYKTLYHFFEDRLKWIRDNEDLMNDVKFSETAIWKKLYSFQEQGVKGAIFRLLKYGGCIIADSVGLGKTFSALAVITFFELQNKDVLVLCPKRLRENWTHFLAATAHETNSLKDDRFRYHVLSHTDLGREKYTVDGIDLANFNWGNYSLVVIDESHNFRNGPCKRKKDGKKEHASRYDFLIEKVIKAGVPTKVLMLSATPVNNTLNDLTNQIHIISGGNDNYFNQQDLEITSVSKVIKIAQAKFVEWQKTDANLRNKEKLLEGLSDDFFQLLDGLTIARSRSHIKQFYPKFIAQGGFAERAKPQNKHLSTDSKNELIYEDMVKRIEAFKLAIYDPLYYQLSNSDSNSGLSSINSKYENNPEVRDNFLIHMMKVNYLKRLESSVQSFRLTIDRTITKINDKLQSIEDNQKIKANKRVFENELDEEDFEDEEDLVGVGNTSYRLSDLDLGIWKKDLVKEKEVLEGILEVAKKVTPERDKKLSCLREEIIKKLKVPNIDKKDRENRKILIFTTFADTAKYLYKELLQTVRNENCHIGQIAGSSSVLSTAGTFDYQGILDRFSPRGREQSFNESEQIDILIATDCISEGQNLQDCDTVINFDIHWNPVRIIQRFGRIDRLNSDNKLLNMINFWPTEDLDKHLKLQNRVLSRMELANIAATGKDNLFDPVSDPEDQSDTKEENIQLRFDFRSKQMEEIIKNNFELVANDSFELYEFTLDNFQAELLAFLDKNSKLLEDAPFGLFSVTHQNKTDKLKIPHPLGVVFCLRRKLTNDFQVKENLPKCRLVYIDEMNKAYAIGNTALSNLRELARDKDKVISELARKFDHKTKNGQNMNAENAKIKVAVETINRHDNNEESKRVTSGGLFSKREERDKKTDDYDIVSWLVVSE